MLVVDNYYHVLSVSLIGDQEFKKPGKVSLVGSWQPL